jgi:sugar O-acyltransferase (sialic acid O-acetyltransferase NeuD family)
VDVIVLAASGLAREAMAAMPPDVTFVGVLDDDADMLGRQVGGVRVLGDIDSALGYPDASFVIAAGRGAARRRIRARLALLGIAEDRFARVLAPGVTVPDNSSIGAGSIVLASVVITSDVQIGRHVVIMPGAILTHDDVVDDYATLCAGVALGGHATVGEAAYVGMNASVRERATVGADAVLGMGSALVTDLPPGETWAGVPARPLQTARGSRR